MQTNAKQSKVKQTSCDYYYYFFFYYYFEHDYIKSSFYNTRYVVIPYDSYVVYYYYYHETIVLQHSTNEFFRLFQKPMSSLDDTLAMFGTYANKATQGCWHDIQ